MSTVAWSRRPVRKLDDVNNVHAVRQRLLDRAALGHLCQPNPLSVSERPMNRDVCLDPVDPTVDPLVAAQAVVCVDPVEFEPYVDSVEADGLMVRVQPQGYRDAGRQPSEEEFIGRRSGIRSAREGRLIPPPGKLASLYLYRGTRTEMRRVVLFRMTTLPS